MNKRRPDWLHHDPPTRRPLTSFHRERRDYVGELMGKTGLKRKPPQEQDPQPQTDDLDELKAGELKLRMKDAGISWRMGMTKGDMIAALRGETPAADTTEKIVVG